DAGPRVGGVALVPHCEAERGAALVGNLAAGLPGYAVVRRSTEAGHQPTGDDRSGARLAHQDRRGNLLARLYPDRWIALFTRRTRRGMQPGVLGHEGPLLHRHQPALFHAANERVELLRLLEQV